MCLYVSTKGKFSEYILFLKQLKYFHAYESEVLKVYYRKKNDQTARWRDYKKSHPPHMRKEGHNPLKSDMTLWPTFGRLFDETASVAPIISCKANDITSLENILFWLTPDYILHYSTLLPFLMILKLFSMKNTLPHFTKQLQVNKGGQGNIQRHNTRRNVW